MFFKTSNILGSKYRSWIVIQPLTRQTFFLQNIFFYKTFIWKTVFEDMVLEP